jgi:hypothetical protein
VSLSHKPLFFATQPFSHKTTRSDCIVECPRIMSTDLDVLRLLAEWHEVRDCLYGSAPINSNTYIAKLWLYQASMGLTSCHSLLASFGEVESAGTSTGEMEKPPLKNNAVFPPLLWTGKWCETSKRPRFTQYGQEPNGIKLSPKQTHNREVVELQVFEFTITSPVGSS